MSPTSRPSSRRATAVAGRSASGRQPAAKASSRRSPAAGAGEALQPAPAAPGAAGATRRPGSSRSARPPAKKSYANYIVIGVVVACVIGGLAYRPVMRKIKLGTLDKAIGVAAIAAADDYLIFEDRSEPMVREVIRSNRGPFDAQVHMASAIQSFPALMSIAERKELSVEQRAVSLTAAAAAFSPDKHKGERVPSEMKGWAETSEDRGVAIAAMSVLAACGATTHDQDTVELLARVVAKPGQDPLRITAALDGLVVVADESSLGHVISLLRSSASDQVLAHAGIIAHIHALARPAHLGALVELLDHPQATVRALGLETLGGLTMPESADPKSREALGQRIAAKLVPATPPVELAAALKATGGLRLTGARDAVLALLPQRGTLALPDVSEAWWSDCLGRALILSQPAEARVASEDLITKLAAALGVPASRPVAAKALALIGDGTFLSLRPALDALCGQGTDPACVTALSTIVKKTYDRSDVSSACGEDLKRWKEFLAKDKPRSLRVAEIRTFVDTHQEDVRASVGRTKLKQTQEFLDAATAELQGWLDDKNFVPPLGLTTTGITNILHDVKTLHFSVVKAMPTK